MFLRQPGFTYSSCGPSNKNKERIHKFKETDDSRYIYRNELDKVFSTNMKIQPEQQPQKKYYVVNYLKLRDKSFKIK